MNAMENSGKKQKTSGLFWVLLGLCAVATAGLAVFVCLMLFMPASEGSPEEVPVYQGHDYSEEQRYGYWRGFDATALAAVVCQEFPEAGNALLAEGEDENFLAMTVYTGDRDLRLHFSLRSADMTFYGSYPGYDRGFVYTSRVYYAEYPEELAAYYGDHLKERGGKVRACLRKDLDGDGQLEYVYIVDELMDSWLDGSDGGAQEMEDCRVLRDKQVCVYIDIQEEELAVHSFCLPQKVENVTDAVWDNGMLHLIYDRDGEKAVCRFLVGQWSYPMMENYDGCEELLRKLCTRYATYLEDQGYTDVRMRLADVSSAPGSEVLCCYSDGKDYTAEVFTARYGRLHTLFRKQGVHGSVFLVRQYGEEFLLDYSQDLSASDYSQSYAFCLFRFDEDFARRVEDEDSIRIGANQGGGEAGSQFFSKVNRYLSESEVCYDPYALTGYTVMREEGDENSLRPDSLYLRISNCSTNKTGVVTLQDYNSFLNFRSGPSTAYDLVRINPYDHYSFVKQVHGSIVTVIMPYNTGDPYNPIWAQIRINYQNRTMEGFSSQRYIRIEGIRHLNVGDSFTITADTNDTGLYWTCSDTMVATIDPNTGTLTAHAKGLVLITVRSTSGLEDSCLIMIE